jgi:hypothetical protein
MTVSYQSLPHIHPAAIARFSSLCHPNHRKTKAEHLGMQNKVVQGQSRLPVLVIVLYVCSWCIGMVLGLALFASETGYQPLDRFSARGRTASRASRTSLLSSSPKEFCLTPLGGRATFCATHLTCEGGAQCDSLSPLSVYALPGP